MTDLPQRTLERFYAWVRGGAEPHAAAGQPAHHDEWPWYRVLWLTGVDYFSTLGYQPGIALLAAGALSPIATLVLVLVTLFGALPIYGEVAKRSFQGQGSISMLERLVPSWWGKLLVLSLIGFATTDFVITMTLSAADAAQHAAENPLLHHWLEGQQEPLTLGLLALLTLVFLKGFREAVGLATWLAVPYLLLNLVVVGRGTQELLHHPELVDAWKTALHARLTEWRSGHVDVGDGLAIALIATLTFPKLALGLSGFETGVTVMPQVAGLPTDGHGNAPPLGRIHNTRLLLGAAALIMSFFLVATSIVTTLLIPESAWREGGEASGRALAWVAHTYLGPAFGTVYDVSTILILWFAGASAMAALLNLIPRYLPRFGMAPGWVMFPRALVLAIFAIDVIVTLAFDANVEKQGGAYATGVLALILSASLAVTLAKAREATGSRWRSAAPWAVITAVFTFTFADNVLERPDGIIISSIFIGSVLVLGAVSRWLRATELRVENNTWNAPGSRELFDELRGKGLYIVTLRDPEGVLDRKRAALGMDTRFAIFTAHRNRIRQHYNVDGPFCFVHVDLAADQSTFGATIDVRMQRTGDDYVMVIKGAAAVANAIAWVSEEIKPAGIFLGLTQENPMRQALQYLVWGKGETGILVYQILLKRWESLPDDAPRPTLYLMSDPQRHPGAA